MPELDDTWSAVPRQTRQRPVRNPYTYAAKQNTFFRVIHLYQRTQENIPRRGELFRTSAFVLAQSSDRTSSSAAMNPRCDSRSRAKNRAISRECQDHRVIICDCQVEHTHARRGSSTDCGPASDKATAHNMYFLRPEGIFIPLDNASAHLISQGPRPPIPHFHR
jgi:hypothetical protein